MRRDWRTLTSRSRRSSASRLAACPVPGDFCRSRPALLLAPALAIARAVAPILGRLAPILGRLLPVPAGGTARLGLVLAGEPHPHGGVEVALRGRDVTRLGFAVSILGVVVA